jgi:hypothetical protein
MSAEIYFPIHGRWGKYIILSKPFRSPDGRNRPWKVVALDTTEGEHRIIRLSKLLHRMFGRTKATLRKKYPALYAVFNAMRARCYLPWHKSYKYYGARGIRVSAAWFSNFDRFATWAISEEWYPGCGLWLEQVDNENGGYSEVNCTFVSPKEQARNRRPPK